MQQPHSSYNRILNRLLIACTFAALPHAAQAQTSITYQGQLKNAGSPVNGNVNMTFKLFDALAAGAQQGATLTFDGVGGNPPPIAVTNGLFTAQLDFTATPFAANQPRWLEIAVNGTTLAPRQPLTAVPVALNTRGINVSAAGNVGIGTTTPSAKLQIAGTPGVDGIKFPDGTTQVTASAGGAGFWSASGSHIFKNNAGNVGIGISAPFAPLHVNSTTAGSADNTAHFSAPGIGPNSSHIHWGTTGDWYIRSASASGKLVLQDLGGRVGIGTTNPASLLDVRGVVTLDTGGDAAIFTGTGVSELNRYLNLLNSSGLQSASGLKAGGVLVSDNYFWANPGKNDLVVKGLVGIGTPTPTAPLSIQTPDSIFSNGVGWSQTDGTRELASIVNSSGGWLGTRTNHPLHFYTNNSTAQMTLAPGGLLGIGTTTPLHRLTVSTGPSNFGLVHTDGVREVGTYVSVSGGWLGTRSNHSLHFFTGNSNPLMTLTTAGNLGIGTTGPAAKLDVVGTTRTTVLQVVGADLAEKFPCSGARAEPGTVMEIDPDHAGKLMVARGAYNQRVAGVVSGANDFPAGAILGHLPGNEDAPPIALSGRVWVKCDAGSSGIRPGDMLTTSATPGHAMKAVDREKSQGAVIGKAMTALESGKGLVLVLVSLQ